ncbi:MAG: Hpt domain-containing protein, partial [Lachnospiraceae bacterium]|nr:Hpt domain-containing protein [Lachnospiraceae bacterium]
KELLFDDKIDMEAFRIKAHAMKSTSALVGAIPVSGMAKVLENAAREGDEEKIRNLSGPFLEEWYSLGEKLKPLVIENVGPKEDFDPDVFLALLEMAERSAETLEVDELDEIVKKLENITLPEELSSDVHHIEVAIDELDSENIKLYVGIARENFKTVEDIYRKK